MLSNLRKFFKILFIITLGLYTAVWFLSPWVANHYLGQYLQTQGLSLSDDTSIRYNPFRSRLEINALDVTAADDSKVLSLSFLSFEWHLHQLIFEDVYIPLIVISGLDLTVAKMGTEIVVAGISLALPGENKNVSQNDEASTVEGQELSFLKRLVMPKLVLDNSNVTFNVGGNLHQLALHNVEINNLLATSQKQAINLVIKSELDNGPIEIKMSANFLDKEGGIDFDIDISNVDVQRFSHLLANDINTLEGRVNYKGRHSLKVQNDSVVLNIETGHLMGADMNIGLSSDNDTDKNDAHILIGQQDINLDGIFIVLDKDKQPKVKGEASVLVQDFSIYNNEKSEVLADVKQITFSPVTFFSDDQEIQKVSIGQTTVDDAFFSDNLDNPIPALAKFTSLNISDIDLSQYGIEVGDINLAGFIANAELDENKQLKNLIDTSTSNDDNSTEVTKGTAALDDNNPVADTKPAFTVKLNSFGLTNTAEVFFLDNSVNPTYQQKVAINTFTAGPFDSNNPEQESTITLEGNSDRYSTFSFVTKAKPFLEKPSYNIKGDFKEFSLPGLSSYIKQALQYEIESGQLDLDIDVQLTGNDIDGEVQVMLRGIELTAADDSETASLNDQTSVPFNMALGMLKDGDGNVELSLPITGDTSSPDFGLSGFLTLLVKQATILGARDYLVTTFIPYAQVVNIAVLAGEYALKVRINDLPYSAKETALQPDQQEFLKQFRHY
jgi:hypothetical protein